ncbi:hypothetical protein SLEP1_g13806 [Rubroshorea leprosula]|uniref:Uncharacterized protein n=1 Tax=Rubroshorea leprosula TaxID=152421 RepID=A0AAV5ILJ8_9ROSI|nr:hypothetical protein SLEP1_g13806 [Rubroshorea leprosula]
MCTPLTEAAKIKTWEFSKNRAEAEHRGMLLSSQCRGSGTKESRR